MRRIVVYSLICLLVTLFAAPMGLILIGREFLASFLWSDNFDPIYMRTSVDGIVFGEDKKRLSDLAKRLRAASARPDEAPLNRIVHIAILDGLPQAEAKGGGVALPKISIDLGDAGDAAVILFKLGALSLRVENATADQRAKIGVEGLGPFVLEGARDGLLSGFRIDSFGASGASQPSDYLDTVSSKDSQFCDSVRQWAGLYKVAPATMRIYVFRQPTRIEVHRNHLGGAPSPKSSPTWTAGVECGA